MARQRFIWPSIWDDPDLGRLSSDARLLYIGCFSLADDDGRIIGDPVYLKTSIFRYRPLTPGQVKKIRDEVASTCRHFVVYEAHSVDYIAFTNWRDFQKPKYPKPSKLPPPPRTKRPQTKRASQKSSGNDSSNGSAEIPPRFPHRVGLGRDGLGTTKTFLPSTSLEDPASDPPTPEGREGRIINFDPILGDVA